jgi:hypothetical protein
MSLNIASLKHGETRSFQAAGGEPVKVSYHTRQSHGDNGKRVMGAVNGEYTVEYSGGRTTSHDHGPHANTESAARRGANPNARGMTASRVESEVTRHLHAEKMGFKDRR